MRLIAPTILAFAATALAATSQDEKVYTLELGPGETIEVTEEGKLKLIDEHRHFIDITEFKDSKIQSVDIAAAGPYPTAIKFKSAVEALFPKIKTDRVKSQLTEYSSFYNRYYRSQYGVDAAQWLYARIEEALNESGVSRATVRYVTHPTFVQPSIIVSVPGTTSNKVILSSHIDSVVSSSGGVVGRAPGADDNGSGSMNNLEVLRAVLSDPEIAAGNHVNTLEWHFFAGEEGGLLGSQYVFSDYSSRGEKVLAVLNQDMVGYKGRDGKERFGLITDNANADQNKYLKLLIDTYADISYEESKCGYGCSDHASATKYGYRASFLFETPYGNHSPYIHTANDTINTVDFAHAFQHAKVATGFLVELAHHQFA